MAVAVHTPLSATSQRLAARAVEVACREQRSWLHDWEIPLLCRDANATPVDGVALMRAGVWRRVPGLRVEVTDGL